jgi:hypothetical protein
MAYVLGSTSPETTAQTSYTDNMTSINVRWRPVKESKRWKNAHRAELMHRIRRQRVHFLLWLIVFLIEEREVEIVVYPPKRYVPSSLKHSFYWRSLFVEASR